MRRVTQKQIEHQQSQQSEFLAGDEYQEKSQSYERCRFQNYQRAIRYKLDPPGYQEAWRPQEHKEEYDCQGPSGYGYEERCDRNNAWKGSYHQNYGYDKNQWQIVDNSGFQLDQRINEACLENQSVGHRDNEEDEFEQFLNGPFAKKYDKCMIDTFNIEIF